MSSHSIPYLTISYHTIPYIIISYRTISYHSLPCYYSLTRLTTSGCGKTMCAKATAREAGARFINLDISSLTDKW